VSPSTKGNRCKNGWNVRLSLNEGLFLTGESERLFDDKEKGLRSAVNIKLLLVFSVACVVLLLAYFSSAAPQFFWGLKAVGVSLMASVVVGIVILKQKRASMRQLRQSTIRLIENDPNGAVISNDLGQVFAMSTRARARVKGQKKPHARDIFGRHFADPDVALGELARQAQDVGVGERIVRQRGGYSRLYVREVSRGGLLWNWSPMLLSRGPVSSSTTSNAAMPFASGADS